MAVQYGCTDQLISVHLFIIYSTAQVNYKVCTEDRYQWFLGEVCDGQRSVPSEQTKTYTLTDLDKFEFSPMAGCMEVQFGVSANYLR